MKSLGTKCQTSNTLYTAAKLAVQASVKIGLPYWNDKIKAIFFTAYKNQDNAKVASVSSSS